MHFYDFCLAWNWEYDEDFVGLLDSACASRGVSFLQVTPCNLEDILEALEKEKLSVRVFFDRASEADANFLPLVQWAVGHAAYRINPRDRATRVMNKAAMHYELIHAGLHTPYTIILPSYSEQPDLPALDLSPLGDMFTVKPAHGGGGEGVVTAVASLSQVQTARQDYPADCYLLQAHIVPARLEDRPAWFRIIFCTGKVNSFWWDPAAYVYVMVSEEEERCFSLSPLHSLTATLARLCGLDLFSTEVALTSDGQFIVVDYVNDQIDLRLKSNTPDGVPDDAVREIAGRLADLASLYCPPSV